MELIETLFYQLIEKTDKMLVDLKVDLETNKLNSIQIEFDDFFEERELLLKSLHEKLERSTDRVQFLSLYELWQVGEVELTSLVKKTSLELKKKTSDSQNARTISLQYDSYLKQAPHGAFLDKKR